MLETVVSEQSNVNQQIIDAQLDVALQTTNDVIYIETEDVYTYQEPVEYAVNPEEVYPRINTKAQFYGVVNLGDGNGVISYDNNGFKISKIGDFVPKVMLFKDKLKNGQVTQISDDGVHVDYIGTPFVKVDSFARYLP